jgi:L-histidine Nalpha-methyltransferase
MTWDCYIESVEDVIHRAKKFHRQRFRYSMTRDQHLSGGLLTKPSADFLLTDLINANLFPEDWSRLQIDILSTSESLVQASDGADVIQGLSHVPKTLPAKYFYDDVGSHLFEEICALPEYYLTRTERQILEHCADEIVAQIGSCDLVELGSGSATKTQILFRAYGDHPASSRIRYIPIDVSGGMLKQSALELLAQYANLEIHGLVGTYDRALAHLPTVQQNQRLIVFLGSSLGNLDEGECDRLFRQVCDALNPGEYFLLGVDLQKPVEILEAAYNDSQGVTAAFNLNMLNHLNQRFGGNFCLEQFDHEAIYNATCHQIEMHLRSRCDQSVRLEALDLDCHFAAKETIRTEISRKFNLDSLKAQLQRAVGAVHPGHRLSPVKVWSDPQQWFALVLSQLQPV